MYLKRLEIQGFKTFANRTVIEFPTGITAIVGPNGSGKSNFADAIRWVLGEQSFSALRCRRTDDLIYSGGGKRAAQGMAEVALTIDNTDRTLPLDFNEVTIMRRSHRSGENEYYLNKSRVRLKDIQEATSPLAQSYTLVNQGLVDAALTLRPEERRGLFEDAAAISLSVTKRAESERRLRQTEENLSRILDLLADIEPRLRVLKRQAREAEQVQEIETALRSALLSQYRRQWHVAQAALDAARLTLAERAAAVAAAQAAQQALANELASARAERDQARAELEVHTTTLAQSERTLEGTEREWAVLHERRAALDRRASEAAERVAALAAEREAAARLHSDSAARVLAARADLAAARQQLQTIEAEEGVALATRRAAEQSLEAARERAFAAASARSEARNRQRQLGERMLALVREQTEDGRDLAAATERLAAAHTALEQATDQREAAESSLAAAQTAEEAAQQLVGSARTTRREAEEHVASARREVDTMHSRLEALRRTAQSGAGMFGGVKAALQWAERAGHEFALVSSVITVPAELETALEVALGARLQNIVVPHWDAAEAAINELKRTDAGRATFLPLDTLRSGRAGRAPAGAGIIGVASALVGYAERFERVVAQLLGRTLVVEDLATARRVVRDLEGGWSIVTLGGEQVGSAGAVTGGARTREAGTGALRRERELRELPVQLAQAQGRLTEREQALQSAVSAIAAAEQAVREADQQRRAARQSSEQARDLVANRGRSRERAEQELDWHRSRVEAAQREHATLAEQHSRIEQTIATAEAAVAAAEQTLLAARDTATSASAAGRVGEERLAVARAAIGSSELALRAALDAERAQQTAVERLQQTERDLTSRGAEIAAQRELLATQLAELAALRSVQQAQYQAAAAAREPLATRLQAASAASASAESHERDLAQRGLAAQTEAGRAETALAQAQSRHDQLWERCAEENIDLEQIASQPPDDALAETVPAEQIEQLRAKLRRMGTINPLAPTEYAELAERHSFLTTQVDDVRRAANGLRELIAELEEAMNARFAQTFAAVAEEFALAFSRLFGGGTAQLVLNDPESGDGGIEIIAQPPGKRRQPLSLLSGGERSLTAVALLVALLKVNPTPFCVMDEVDAALDEANVVRLRELLLEMSQRTQFVLVTHNRGTVEVADTLYGVTMNPDGASKVLSLHLDELVEDDNGGIRVMA